MNEQDWPNPGDAIKSRGSRGACVAWLEPRIASGIVDIDQHEQLLVLVRALNPGNDCSEEGIDHVTREKWQRTWWMALRPCAKLVWINEAQMSAMYERVR